MKKRKIIAAVVIVALIITSVTIGALLYYGKTSLNPILRVEKTSPAYMYNGSTDSIKGNVTVYNDGNCLISNIVLTDLVTGVTFDGAPIAPFNLAAGGNSEAFEYTWEAPDGGWEAGTVKNTARAAGADPNGQPVSDDGNVTVTILNPILRVEKTGPAYMYHGSTDSIKGDVTVYNDGDCLISNIVLTDLVTGVTFDDAPIAPFNLTAGTNSGAFEYTWAAPDDGWVAGTVKNTARAAGADPNGQPVSDDGNVTITIYAKEVFFQNVSNLVDIGLAKKIIQNLSSMGTMTGINGENLGFRNAGSSAAIQASLYVRDEMNHIGLSNVTLDKIPLDSWELKSAWVNVSGLGKFQAISHGGSSNTSSSPYASPNGSITAEIIDVGNGAESDYIGKNVTGRIVLSNFDWNLWTNTHAFEAQLHGAIAVVFATYENPDTIGPDLAYGLNESAMVAMDGMYKLSYPPVLVISGADGLTLINHIKNSAGPVTATIFSDIKIKTEQEGAFGYNVVGYLPSKNYGKPNDQFMIVGDHTDAWFYGASDNDAGVATVLVIADAFKKAYDFAGSSPNRTIIFITHDAEEWGRFGTYYDWSWGAYYEITHMHPEWVGRTVGAIIPDDVGYNYAFGLEYSPELDTFVNSVLDANQQRLPYGTKYYDLGTSADHWSYAAAGIPSIGCYNWEEFQGEYYHTQLDVEKNINYTYLDGMIVTIADMTFRLANAQILPYNFSLVADMLKTAMVDSWFFEVSQLLPIYQEYGVDSDANLSRAVTAAEDFVVKTNSLAQNLSLAVSQTLTEAELNEVNSLLLGMSKILGQSLLSIGVWDNIGYPYTQSLIDILYLDYSISYLSFGSPTLGDVAVAIQAMKDGVGITYYYDYISEPNYRELYNISYMEGMISFGTQEHLAPAVDVWDEVDRLTQMMDNGTVNTTELDDIIAHLQQKMISQVFVNLENGFHTMWTALEQTNEMIETFISSL